MVHGGVKEANHMKLFSWFVFGAMLYFLAPFIVPVVILYVVIKALNIIVIGRSIEEAHNEN